MANRFEKILEPGMIGPVKTRNRMLKTANGTSFMDDDQTCGARMVAYYERLAKGGIGFLVVESCGVEYPLGIQHVHYDENGNLLHGVQLHFDDDKYIPGFQRLTEAVHKQGCPVSIQFQHSGPWNPTGLLPADRSKRDTCAASDMTREELPGPDFNIPRAYTHQEVEDQIDHWASAAERAYKAGFDACEINHGTCHQGATFLSRVWNKREDEYGVQNYENRTRFLCNCIAEAKRRCGPNFAVHCLFNIVEYNHPKATTLQEGVEMAAVVARVADGINCRAERYGHRGGLIQPDRILYPEPPADLPKDLDWSRGGKGATVPLVEAVKTKVKNIPVWTACRLDPVIGEEYLQRGSIDFVGMTRRILADPELPNKVKEGRYEDVRWCNGCLHCFDERNKNRKLACRTNATLGRELLPEFQSRPPQKKKRVMVVGGGPAGMEAARLAAKRGHDVTLYEKGSFLGGLTPVAAIVKDLETDDITTWIEYFKTQLKKEGVKVHMKTEVTPALVKQVNPDALVIATGPAHKKIDLPGAQPPKFVMAEKMHNMSKTALKFFTSKQLERLSKIFQPGIGKSVVIMGGTLHGYELAEFLVKRGRKVTIVHPGPASELGDRMTIDDVQLIGPWFKQKHVSIWTDAEYKEITARGLKMAQHGRLVYELEGKNVIDTLDLVPDQKSIDQFSGIIDETYIIGSCKEPGLMVDAVKDGAEVGYAL